MLSLKLNNNKVGGAIALIKVKCVNEECSAPDGIFNVPEYLPPRPGDKELSIHIPCIYCGTINKVRIKKPERDINRGGFLGGIRRILSKNVVPSKKNNKTENFTYAINPINADYNLYVHINSAKKIGKKME